MKTLKVKAVESAIVHVIEALDAKVRRFVGRKKDPSKFDQDLLNEGNLSVLEQFPVTGQVEEVPNNDYYRQAVKEGSLLAADEQTAKICNVSLKE